MICGLSCGFASRGSERLLDRGATALAVTGPCIWHGRGTKEREQLPSETKIGSRG